MHRCFLSIVEEFNEFLRSLSPQRNEGAEPLVVLQRTGTEEETEAVLVLEAMQEEEGAAAVMAPVVEAVEVRVYMSMFVRVCV